MVTMFRAHLEDSVPRPTMLLIRHPVVANTLHDLWEAPYITSCRRQFDVVLVEEDCDLDRLCDQYRPELIMLRGAYSAAHRRITIANARSHPRIPRLGLCFTDCFCTSRIPYFHDMELWGCDNTMACYSLLEQCPESAPYCYGLPMIFDDTMCVDHGQQRDVPIWVVGATSPWRPWRAETAQHLMQRFPQLVYTTPHPGYGTNLAPGALIGADFFKAMGRAKFSLTDGTIFGYLVRKHLEIPACGTVLMTEQFQGLAEYGFVDMVNCLIGKGDELMDKLEIVLRDEGRWSLIAKAGHDLVHERHAGSKSDFIYNWWRAYTGLLPGQTLIQHGTFGPYEAVWDGRRGLIPSYEWIPDPLMQTIQQAHADYERGDYQASMNRAHSVLGLKIEHAPARFLMNKLLLRLGRADEALLPQNGLFLFNMARQFYASSEADPVELAWWILAHICSRQLTRAEELLSSYAHVRHAELRRMRWLVDNLAGRPGPPPMDRRPGDRPSIIPHTASSFADWIAAVMPILSVNWGAAPAPILGTA